MSEVYVVATSIGRSYVRLEETRAERFLISCTLANILTLSLIVCSGRVSEPIYLLIAFSVLVAGLFSFYYQGLRTIEIKFSDMDASIKIMHSPASYLWMILRFLFVLELYVSRF